MTQVQEQDEPDAVSEPSAVIESQTDSQPEENTERMVPLSALQATRKKLQEAEAKAQAYHELLLKPKEEASVEEDPSALVEKQQLKESQAWTKREILETVFRDMNPQAVQQINTYLEPILEKKPWLAASVDSAQNRWQRAYEIVQDYMHLVENKKTQPPASRFPSDPERIVQNSMKPGNPVTVGKAAQPKGMEYLKSIQGKKEFREYRQKVLQGEA